MRRADDYMLTAEELRLRRRKFRNVGIAIGISLALVALVFFAGRPARGAIKGWQARRHAVKAFAFLDQQKWTDARDEAVAAYQLRPAEPQALRAVARYLSRTRQQQALEFWALLEKKQKLTHEDRRDEAIIALMSADTERATAAINALLANDGNNAAPIDWLLATQLALQKGMLNEAQSDLKKVLDNAKATERERLQAALFELQASSFGESETDKQSQADAWSRIAKLAEEKTDIALDALILLARRALSSPANSENSLSMKTTELVHAIENHPLAKAPQKLVALDLQIHENPADKNACVDRAISQWKDADVTSLVVLATWLNGHGEYQRELETIPLEKALQTRELFLQHVDALGALGRWDEIKQLLEGERFPLDPVLQRMYLARVNAQLGEKAAAENNWQRALEAAGNDVQKLLTLAEYSEKNGALDVARVAYGSAAAEMPKLRIVQQGRLRMVQASRDTKKIHSVLADMLQIWPNDTAIQNDEAYTRLLLLPNDSTLNSQLSTSSELLAIEHLAEQLVKREPASLPHRTLLALARLKQHRPAAALDAYANIQVAPHALSPSALAVHAAVLFANGGVDDARREIQQAPLEKLLPEERADTAN
ncbi:MAG: hypothetical protein QOI22_1477, partial [Verrucomicrobiota bacterium]